jgi:chondroitin AC lyase
MMTKDGAVRQRHAVLGAMLLTLAASTATKDLAKAEPPAAVSPAAMVLSRERELLLRGRLPDVPKARAWVASLGAEGRWPDIDYNDKQPAGWKTSQHLDRILTLSRLVADPMSPLHDDPAFLAAIGRGLDDWITHRYHNSNWWHNDIGVPIMMRDTIVLLADRLSGARRTGALAVLSQYGRAKAGDGANTMWEARLGLDYALLTGDAALADSQSRLIGGEIAVKKGEGIQSDGSYHQHGPRLQQFHYGGAFMTDGVKLGWLLHGTPWAISERSLTALADCLLSGGEWMQRNGYTVPSTLDRSVSRPGTLRGGNQAGLAAMLRDALPSRAAALDALIARESNAPGAAPLTGFRAFPRSDFATYHRPTFSFFVKTVSSRTLTTETTMNGENLLGHLLGCGDSYILRDGPQYFDLPPVWDWDLIPGVTWAIGVGDVERQPFVGSLGDGDAGVTAMDYRFGVGKGPAAMPTLTAHKLWAADGYVVVCLIGDLHASASVTAPVRTALDQCLLRGPVTVGTGDGRIETVTSGTMPARPLRWIHHDGITYIPLNAAIPVSLRLGPVTGSWRRINRSGSPDDVTMPTFLPTLEQGIAPQGQSSGFALIGACPTPADAARAAARPGYRILRNDSACQAVRFADGALMAAFYQPGELADGGPPLVAVDRPCLLLIRNGDLRVCDPTQAGATVTVSYRGRVTPMVAPSGGQASPPIR